MLAAILLGLYLLGVVFFAFASTYSLKKSDSEEAVQFQVLAEMVPVLAYGVLAMLVVAWPATVAYNIYLHSRKK